MKSEKEKMLAGEPYVAADTELAGMRARAQTLLHDFNSTRPSEVERRRGAVRGLFGAVGPGFDIRPPFFCDFRR